MESQMTIRAQRQRIIALMDENIELTTAVLMLQQQIAVLNTPQEVPTITDVMVGAEITA